MTVSSDRTLFRAGLGAVFAILALNVLTVNGQLPWQDEVFVTSTAWSMAHSGVPKLSVLVQYPQSGSPIGFYGPVSFQAALVLVKMFGLSLAPWRLVCLGGVAFTAIAGALLVRVGGGDRWAQLLAALMLTLVGTISRFLPGRWDYVTTGFFFLGLLPVARMTRSHLRPPLWHLLLGGASLGIALGSTPRSLPLISSMLAALVVTALVFRQLIKPVSWVAAVTSTTAVLVHSAILWPWGLNTFSWYAQVRETARKDFMDVTPVMGGGSWQFDFAHHKVTLAVLALMAVTTIGGMVAVKRSGANAASKATRLFLGALALLNLLQMLALVGRSLSRPEFMLPPIIIAALCWFEWENWRRQRFERLAAAAACTALAVLLLQDLQLGAAVVLSWDRRDPAALTSFVRRTVPRGSTVYGPVGGYFYAVEQAGSRYLYTYEETLEGLKSEPAARIGDKLDGEICADRVYLIWPKADKKYYPEVPAMPEPVRSRVLPESADFHEPDLGAPRNYLLRRLGFTVNKYGYADTAIYRLGNARGCGSGSEVSR